MRNKGGVTQQLGLLVWGLLFFFATPIAAQVDSVTLSSPVADETALFQEIPSVYSASKYEQKVTEAPSAVTIITADEIKKSGYRTLADILQSVNGFYVTSDRNYNFLGVRGFNRPGDYNTRVLLLMDGHRLNDNVYESAGIGTESVIDVDLIDRIEIIRGPSSSLYGTNAFFGVINVLTKRGRDIGGIEASTEMSSYDSYLGRFTYGNKFESGLEWLLSGSVYDSDGHRTLFFKEFKPLTHNGIARNVDDDTAYRLLTKASFFNFSLQGSYLRRNKTVPTGAFGTVFNSHLNQTVDERGYVDLKYEHQLAYQIGLSARLYYDRFYYRGDYLYYDDTPDVLRNVLNQDATIGEWWGSEVKLTKRFWDAHKFTLGGEYRDNFTQKQKNYDVNPFRSFLNDSRSSRIWAFYLQDEFAFWDHFILNAGFRYDHYNSFGSSANPRVALIYSLKNTTVKLLYGEAFRAPSAYEQFYTGGGFEANPNLQPEEITTYELVIEHYFSRALHASIAGYYYTLDNLISQTDLEEDEFSFQFQNAESIEAMGVEFSLEGKWSSGVESRISYALQDTENQDTDRSLTNSPHHLVKVNLIVPVLAEQVFAGLDAYYVSARRTLTGHHASDYFTTDLTLFTQQIIKGAEVSLSFHNLFDQRYGDPGAGEHLQDIIEQDGRTFWVKLKYGF